MSASQTHDVIIEKKFCLITFTHIFALILIETLNLFVISVQQCGPWTTV